MTWQAIPLRAAALIDAPMDSVRHTVLQVDLWQRTAVAVGLRLQVPGSAASWTAGQPVRARRARHRARCHQVAVTLDHAGLPVFTVVSGPAKNARLQLELEQTGAGVLVTADFGNPGAVRGRLARLTGIAQAIYRRRVVWALRTLVGMVTLAHHQTKVVVAAAIVRDGAVLAARRTYPASAAGRWEFPGGKVGVGESDEEALIRELAEELGVQAAIGGRIGPEVSLDVELVLRLYAADIGAADPEPQEHDEIRWLDRGELAEVNWLAADRRLLPAVDRLLWMCLPSAPKGQKPAQKRREGPAVG